MYNVQCTMYNVQFTIRPFKNPLDFSSSVDGEEFVGTLTYSYLVEVVNSSVANDIKSIGTKGQERLLGL